MCVALHVAHLSSSPSQPHPPWSICHRLEWLLNRMFFKSDYLEKKRKENSFLSNSYENKRTLWPMVVCKNEYVWPRCWKLMISKGFIIADSCIVWKISGALYCFTPHLAFGQLEVMQNIRRVSRTYNRSISFVGTMSYNAKKMVLSRDHICDLVKIK